MILSASLLLTAQLTLTQAPVTPMPSAPVAPVAPMQPPATTPMPSTPLQPPAATPPAAVPPPKDAPPAVAPAAPQWPTQIGGKDLAAWIKEFIESKDGSVREQAVKVIPQFGPAARTPALKPLLKRLSEETDPGVRVNIVLVLGVIGFEKPEEAKTICEALNGIILRAGPGSPIRLHATRSLANYGTAGSMALATFESISEDPAWETRQTVAMALGRVGRAKDAKSGASTQALNTLTKRLQKEECAVVRLEIAQSMLLLGPPAFNPMVPGDYPRVIKPYLDIVLKKLESETDIATRIWLTMVMMQYDGNTFTDANVAKIADSLGSPDTYAKYAALRALGILGERAKPALGALIAILKQDDLNMIAESITTLAAMKAAAKDAVPELDKLKDHKNETIKAMAKQAVDAINKAPVIAPPAAPMPVPPKK